MIVNSFSYQWAEMIIIALGLGYAWLIDLKWSYIPWYGFGFNRGVGPPPWFTNTDGIVSILFIGQINFN
jgi:hypothetical protein